MSKESIYGEYLPKLEAARDYLVKEIEIVREEMKKKYDLDPVEHLISRIKSEESMREKCRRKGFEETTESALTKIFDAVGMPVVRLHSPVQDLDWRPLYLPLVWMPLQ